MKKAIIVTVYNSENCGSYLQAYALKKTLEENNYQVSFLQRGTENTSHDFRKTVKKTFRNIRHLRFLSAFQTLKQWYCFEMAQRNFFVCTRNDDFYKEADLIVLGSDTIWNFESSYFSVNASIYTGADFVGKKVISYAASVGNTTLNTFADVIARSGRLGNVHTVLVRDSRTKSYVEKTTTHSANIVCDPTLLLTPKIFSTFERPYLYKQKCLLIYSFDEFEEDMKNAIVTYAREKNLIVVSLIRNFGWVDVIPITTPENMITYYANAQAVVTDTFHGTAFSLIYELPFVVIDKGKVKVHELLEAYSESKRLITTVFEFKKIINTKNVVGINGKLLENRLNSLRLLKKVLK